MSMILVNSWRHGEALLADENSPRDQLLTSRIDSKVHLVDKSEKHRVKGVQRFRNPR